MKRILVTGFEPFQGQSVNPSQELLLRVAKDCETLLLPVSFQRSWPLLRSKIELNDFDFILMLGQAGGRPLVGVERIAINLADSEIADEDGQSLLQQSLVEKAPAAYISTLPLNQWLQSAKKRNLPVEISNSAGLFVCNYLYYQTLHHLTTGRGPRCQALFVHFPYLPSQGTPSLPLEQMEECLRFVVEMIEI